MTLFAAITTVAALRGAAAREDWDAVHEGLTSLGFFLAMEATEAIGRAMEEVRAAYAAYAAAAAGLRRAQIHELLAARLGAAAADRALDGIGEDLGDLTPGELEARLFGIML